MGIVEMHEVKQLEAAVPFARFGLSEEVFEAMLQHYGDLSIKNGSFKSNSELPFGDWEAVILSRILQSDDKDLCAVIAAMMNYVKVMQGR